KILKSVARSRLGLDPSEKIIVFFGFIRRYKGLDLLLEAMADSRIKEQNIKLLIAGEFYEDEQQYRKIVADLGLSDRIILHNHFISDAEVQTFICAGDCIVQPYRNATQSGVTPLAYHFEKPMIVTNVGGLPALVPHRKAGLVAEPDAKGIAAAILEFYHLGEEFFLPHLIEEKKKLSWQNLTDAILKLSENLRH
ncbi:MAG TPA: glycosyltransferase, partial [Flavisolibacter sp.]